MDSGAAEAMWGSASRERTFFELDLSDPETWDLQHLEMVGLDGFSERLRRMVAKPITREVWRAFLRGLCTASVPRGKPLTCGAALPLPPLALDTR